MCLLNVFIKCVFKKLIFLKYYNKFKKNVLYKSKCFNKLLKLLNVFLKISNYVSTSTRILRKAKLPA